MSLSKEQLEKIEKLRMGADKKYGKNSIITGQTEIGVCPIVSSSGSLNLDIALGVMGIPRGRIIEIYGPESAGKTTVMLHIIAEVQKSGGVAAFIDAEHALDPLWATKLGVKMNELLLSQPSSGEEALQLAEDMVESGVVDFVCVDSVSTLVPKAELEGDIGDSHMGLQARLMGQALRKINPKVSKSKCTLAFVNQIRHKIGVMFGSPETTSGGNALKFYASIRMDVRNDSDKDINEEFGQKAKNIKVKIVKNKVAPPFKVAKIVLNTNEDTEEYGFSKYAEILAIAVKQDLVQKAGGWYKYKEERFQGSKNFVDFLKQNKSVYDELYNKIINSIEESQKILMESFNSNSIDNAITDAVESNKKRRTKKSDENMVSSDVLSEPETTDAEIVED